MAHRYAPVGCCIYCGDGPDRVDLDDEHIVPLAFNGTLVLPEASCRKCAHVINQQVENPVLSQEWERFRAKHRLPTRRPKNRRKYIRLGTTDGGTFRVRATEYTAPVPIYKCVASARILTGAERIPNSHAWEVSMLASSDEEVRLQKKYPQWNRRHIVKVEPYRFMRFVTKIGYGLAVANLGLDCFTPLAREIILGQSDDYFRLVGCDDSLPPPDGQWSKDGQHQFFIHLHCKEIAARLVLFVVVYIKLFGDAGMPLYHVVAGEVDLHDPKQFAAIEKHRAQGRMAVLAANNPIGPL